MFATLVLVHAEGYRTPHTWKHSVSALPMTTSINKKIAIGAGWTISLRWASRFMRLVSIAILARLLLPSDFGLVAYALVFLAILDEFSMFGFQTVLIRDQDATKEQYSTVWTLEVIRGRTFHLACGRCQIRCRVF